MALLHKKLEHCRGVDVTEDTRCPGNCLFDRIKLINLRRHNKISHTLAGDGKTFAVRIAHKCIAIKVRDIRNFYIVGNFTVWLICDNINCVAVFLLFFCQYFTYAFNRFFRINGTGRIVWRVHNNALRFLRNCLFKCVRVDLEIFCPRRHGDKFDADRFQIKTVFRKIWGKRDKFISRIAQRTKTNVKRARSANGEIQIFPGKMCAVAVIEPFRDGIPRFFVAGRSRVTVKMKWIFRFQKMHQLFFYTFRRRNIGISDTKIVNIFLADNLAPFKGKVKHFSDCRTLTSNICIFFRNHKHPPFVSQ